MELFFGKYRLTLTSGIYKGNGNKIRVLLSATLSWTLGFENFATARRSSQTVVNLDKR